MPIVQPLHYDPTSAGAYSTSDEGCCGDQYAISPAPYPVPGYLRMFESWKQAVDESIDTCALQQGRCWVIRRDQTLPRCGQRGGRGECENKGPVSPGFAGAPPTKRASLGDIARLGASLRDREPFAFDVFPDPVRRAVATQWASLQGWKPLAEVTPQGIAPVIDGCVLPVWQRVWYVGDENNRFTRPGNPMLYRAAVNAAMLLAAQQRRPRVIFGRNGARIVPVVYVHPGGIVRAARRARGPEVVAEPMTPFDVRQAEAASRGASLMPFGY